MEAFLAALRDGDFGALVALLDPDVVFRDDSTEGPADAAALMRGSRAVGSYALTFSRGARFVHPALVNGAVGLAIVPRQGQIIEALAFTFKDGMIAGIEGISDPDRLRHVDPAALGS